MGAYYVIINNITRQSYHSFNRPSNPKKIHHTSLFSFPDQKKQSPLPSYETSWRYLQSNQRYGAHGKFFPFSDIKVLEFEGLAPTLFCGMYFADQGAQVILVGRKEPAPFSILINQNLMNRGKIWITLSPKVPKEKRTIEELIANSDIIIDPFRPGVLEKLNLGPEFIFKINKKVILLRVSGYGQSGPMSLKPGHDLNYISTSGIVPMINSNNQSKVSQFPTNYLADFVSCSLGITATLSALAIAKVTGVGRVIDCSMTDGCRYFAKLINQIGQSKQVSVLEPKFMKWNEYEYLILSKVKDQAQSLSLIKQMHKQDKTHLRTDQIQISRLNKIPALQESIKGLRNPFDNSFNGDQKQVPQKDISVQEIKKMLKLSQVGNSKL